MIRAVFFDLDGTLLPMQMNEFIETYFGAAAKKMAPLGIDTKKMIDGIWKGTGAMVQNDGSVPNETVFWNVFAQVMGDGILEHKGDFDEFYRNEFGAAQAITHPNPAVPEIISWLKEKGMILAVATNPVFPETAQMRRIGWAGLNPEDFATVSTYENSHYCKPNLAYYQELLDRLGLKPEETLMVGNDVGEDMAAAKLGMPVFLVTDYLWNEKNLDTTPYPQGDFAMLKQYIETLLSDDTVK